MLYRTRLVFSLAFFLSDFDTNPFGAKAIYAVEAIGRRAKHTLTHTHSQHALTLWPKLSEDVRPEYVNTPLVWPTCTRLAFSVMVGWWVRMVVWLFGRLGWVYLVAWMPEWLLGWLEIGSFAWAA